MKVIRQGMTRSDFLRIAMLSRRGEEREFGSVSSLQAFPEYDPDAVVLELDGQVVAGGGLRMVAPNVGALWIASMIELGPYRKPLMRHGRRIVAAAKAKGIRVVSIVPDSIPRAKMIPEHLGLLPQRKTRAGTLYST